MPQTPETSASLVDVHTQIRVLLSEMPLNSLVTEHNRTVLLGIESSVGMMINDMTAAAGAAITPQDPPVSPESPAVQDDPAQHDARRTGEGTDDRRHTGGQVDTQGKRDALQSDEARRAAQQAAADRTQAAGRAERK